MYIIIIIIEAAQLYNSGIHDNDIENDGNCMSSSLMTDWLITVITCHCITCYSSVTIISYMHSNLKNKLHVIET